MSRILLQFFTVVALLSASLTADTPDDYAGIMVQKYYDTTLSHKRLPATSLFRDINVTFKLLTTRQSAFNLTNIAKHDAEFKPLDRDEMFEEDNVTYWLRVDLGDAFPSGRFLYSYGDATIAAHTITPRQHPKIFQYKKIERLEFTYDRLRDAHVYYFHLKPRHFRIPLKGISVSTRQSAFINFAREEKLRVFLGFIMGLILMAAIYNGALYYYNRDKSLLYYALMQLFMVLLLYSYSGAFVMDEESFFSRNQSYISIVGLLTAAWATLFGVNFLETRTYAPRLHTLLRAVLWLMGIDLVISLFGSSLLLRYHIVPLFILLLLYVAYRRTRQRYKPAYYYLAGWILLGLAVLLDSFQIGYNSILFPYLYLGAAAEAILFSLALSTKHRIAIREREQQRQLLIHQSRLASMGEMIGNIAHQWRQPLTHLGYIMMNIQEAQKHGELDNQYLDNKTKEANKQIEFMSQTIDDFRDFYLPNKEKEDFSITEATKETMEIMRNTLERIGVNVELKTINDTVIHNYKNEYKQVLLNLLTNAKDALVDNSVKQPHIVINIDKNRVVVEDNAGGVDREIIDKIFDPYFTTKRGNSGIGLYMSKIIIERNMNGKMWVKNGDDGAMFIIDFS
jgi:signal transduction histidine kinase